MKTLKIKAYECMGYVSMFTGPLEALADGKGICTPVTLEGQEDVIMDVIEVSWSLFDEWNHEEYLKMLENGEMDAAQDYKENFFPGVPAEGMEITPIVEKEEKEMSIETELKETAVLAYEMDGKDMEDIIQEAEEAIMGDYYEAINEYCDFCSEDFYDVKERLLASVKEAVFTEM